MKRICALLLILFTAAGCSLLENEQPASGPGISNTPESGSDIDSSPRSTPGVDLPPTWTPISESLEAMESAPPGSDGSSEVEIDTTGKQTYEVQPGDTLLDIAIQFQVSLDELAQINNIQDIDHVEVGTILIIP